MSNAITSSTSSPQRLTPFEQDTRNYGKAAATVLGGARALGDLAGATCTISPQARAAVAAAAAPATALASAGSTATGFVDEAVQEVGEWVDAAEQALDEFGDDVAEVSRQVVAQAAAAYGSVVGMADKVGELVSDAADVVTDAADAVVDGVAGVADDVAGYALMLASL